MFTKDRNGIITLFCPEPQEPLIKANFTKISGISKCSRLIVPKAGLIPRVRRGTPKESIFLGLLLACVFGKQKWAPRMSCIKAVEVKNHQTDCLSSGLSGLSANIPYKDMSRNRNIWRHIWIPLKQGQYWQSVYSFCSFDTVIMEGKGLLKISTNFWEPKYCLKCPTVVFSLNKKVFGDRTLFKFSLIYPAMKSQLPKELGFWDFCYIVTSSSEIRQELGYVQRSTNFQQYHLYKWESLNI